MWEREREIKIYIQYIFYFAPLALSTSICMAINRLAIHIVRESSLFIHHLLLLFQMILKAHCYAVYIYMYTYWKQILLICCWSHWDPSFWSYIECVRYWFSIHCVCAHTDGNFHVITIITSNRERGLVFPSHYFKNK